MITLTMTGQQEILAYLQGYLPKLTKALTKRMDEFSIQMQRTIQTEKLTGGNPLHHRSGKLINSIRVINAQFDGSVLSGGVEGGGGPAFYGRVHEFGGTFMIPEHMRRFIGKSTFRGMVKSGKATGLGITHGMVKAHTATFPMRSFMRSTQDEYRERIIAGLQQTVDETLQ